ncbi:Hachiman antiphage defense system protein HamA [Limosilactobacillus urinaemulieris]|uniref:Hachiman antiphage defense system protein HamA n=1 Tax=Limosilactobacillus urinaemulieris TaxID=2742600 RepID=UPI0028ECFF7F|nr:Hachiman antiphage defense system protein HamA [Limosilactobacillus urinaemulieris]
MVNNEFRTLIDSLRIAMSEEDSGSIETSVRVVLDKYTGEWKKPYSTQNLKRLYYHGLNRNAAKKIKNAGIDEDSLKKYIDDFSDEDKEIIAKKIQTINDNDQLMKIDQVSYYCVNWLSRLFEEARNGQQKKSTISSGHDDKNDISLTVREAGNIFEKTFNPIKEIKLPLQRSRIRSFALLPVKGIYSHKNLISLLRKNLARYVFSRKNRNECDDLEELTAEATTELREFVRKCNPQTLLGELLVYIFLEHCEKAPKILTRAEFYQKYGTIDKKSIFLGKDDAGWQLIIGTPNLSSTLDQAILSALKNCEKLKNQSDFGGGPYVAEQLQDSFLEDSYYPEQIKKIETIMFPSLKRKSLGVQVDSYGIFLGYQVDDFENDEERVNKTLTADAERATEMISNFVTSHGMDKHPVYVYLLPFKNPEYESSQIIDKLVGR